MIEDVEVIPPSPEDIYSHFRHQADSYTRGAADAGAKPCHDRRLCLGLRRGGQVLRLDQIPDSAVLAPVESSDTGTDADKDAFRRRLLSIAAAALASAALPALSHALTQWRGVTPGADTSITLAHPQADSIIESVRAEIARLEGTFSLHQPNSALARLNANGHLPDPPFELPECLGQCARLHAATGGAFDPTVQPLRALHARRYAAGHRPAGVARRRAEHRLLTDDARAH